MNCTAHRRYFVREGAFGNGAARMGNARWRRLTEERTGRAKSVFHFDVQGSVANPPMPGFRGYASSAMRRASSRVSSLAAER